MLKCNYCKIEFDRKPSEISNRNFCNWNCWISYNKKNLTNQRFGKLIVEKYIDHKKWLCICDCGNKKIVNENKLLNGTKSCGCLRLEKSHQRHQNLVGFVFGKLKVIEFSEKKKSGQSYWRCQCQCGCIKVIAGFALKNGNTKSCGCLRGKMDENTRKLKKAVNSAVCNVLKNKQDKVFEYLPYSIDELKLHLESLWEPWMNWDNYGGRADNKKKSWWIDHIIPHSYFNYLSFTDPKFIECWQLANLKPMEKIANIKKGSKICH